MGILASGKGQIKKNLNESTYHDKLTILLWKIYCSKMILPAKSNLERLKRINDIQLDG